MPGIYLIVCFLSFFAINLELFLTRILGLKTWNHVVYIVIPFAILGYGIGANIVFLFKHVLQKIRPEKVLAYGLIKIALYAMICTMGIIYLPVCVDDVAQILVNMSSLSVLLWAYIVRHSFHPDRVPGCVCVYISSFPIFPNLFL
ncbi:MAG TPA: hypothetical protein PKU74_05340 [Candidatus Omnitrophota bacterium]|nr:hypothetical protein [Candidatus Omnitrophota bacterium]